MYLLFYKAERLPEPCSFDDELDMRKYILEKLKKEYPNVFNEVKKKTLPPEVISLKYQVGYMLTQLQATIMMADGEKVLNTDFHIMQIPPYYVYKQLKPTLFK